MKKGNQTETETEKEQGFYLNNLDYLHEIE
jgi:hypothetical protein